MPITKKLLYFVLSLSFLFCMSGSALAANRMVMSTSATGGSWYLFGGGLCGLISKYIPDTSASAKPSASSVENLRNVGRGRVDIGMAMPDAAYNAYNGQGDFAKEQYSDVRALFSIHGADTYLYTLKDSGINSVKDFKGKKVAVGAAGSGTEACNRLILDFYGLSYDDIDEVFLSAGEAVQALQDGSLDAAMYSHATPHSLIMDLCASRDVKFIEMGEADIAKFIEKYPYYNASVVKANSYQGQDKDYPTFAYHGIIIVNKNMDDELAYQIVKTLFEHKPELDTIHAQFKEIALDRAMMGVQIPLHPGAERYLREKGVIK